MVSGDASQVSKVVEAITETAISQNEAYENTFSSGEIIHPPDLQKQVKSYRIKDLFKDAISSLLLPQFFIKIPSSTLFGTQSETELERELLLEDFTLSTCDTQIAFDTLSSELYKIDLDETQNDHTPTILKLDGKIRAEVIAYLMDPVRKNGRVQNFSKRIKELIGNLYPISEKDIEKYIGRVLEQFDDSRFQDLAEKEYSYTEKIKQQIRSLSEVHAEEKFHVYLDSEKVF
jgi:type III restriction enzyme